MSIEGGVTRGSLSNESMIASLLNPKRISFAIIGTIEQSVVTLTGLAAMMTVDAIFHYYLVIIMILKQQEDQQLHSILNIVESYINKSVNSNIHIFLNALCCSFFFILVGTMLYIVHHTHSLSTMLSVPGAKKSLNVLFISIMTWIQIPFLLISISAVFIDFEDPVHGFSNNDDKATKKALVFLFATANGCMCILFAFMIQKLYIIRIPSISVHWSASNSQLHSMKLINKVLLVVCFLYITTMEDGTHFYYLTIPTFLMFFCTGMARILIIPHYRYVVEWGFRIIELITGCLLFVLIIGQFISLNNLNSGSARQDLRLCVFAGAVSVPTIIIVAIVLDNWRQKVLWEKLVNNDLKFEIEMEHALYVMIEKVRIAMANNDKNSNLAFSDLISLIDIHNRKCTNENCACQKSQIVQYVMNRGFAENSIKFVLDDEEIRLINKATVTPLIRRSNNHLSVKNLTVLQHMNFYAASAAAELSDIGSAGAVTTKIKEGLVLPVASSSVQVNVAAMKVAFLNQFSEILFLECKKKFPLSKRLFFQYAYFALNCCKNRYMTETLLRTFDNNITSSSKVGWIEQVSVQINELMTIMEIERVAVFNSGNITANPDQIVVGAADQAKWGVSYLKNGKNEEDSNMSKKSGVYTSLEKFNSEYFAFVSEITECFYLDVETFATSVSNFWKTLQSDTLDVDTAHKDSLMLANIIAKVFTLFKNIEKSTEGGATAGRTMDFRVCYTFAILQKLLLNDLSQYDLYINKMNSQREMMRLIRNNTLSQSSKGPEDTGFILAHGSMTNFGKVIMCNNLFRKTLGYNIKEIIHLNIEEFMPELIRKWHASFVNEFNKNSGAYNGMINKTNCNFLKKKNGYLIPVMINVRFNYSKDYGFTFVMYINFMQEIQISKKIGTGRHRVENVMFFICDNDEGSIIDISQSCIKQIGLQIDMLRNSGQENEFTSFTVQDLIPELPLRKIKELRSEHSLQNLAGGAVIQSIEQIVDLDMDVVRKLRGDNKGVGIDLNKVHPALCQVFLECYGPLRDKYINILAVVLLDQYALKEYLKDQKIEKKERQVKRQDRKDRQDIAAGMIKDDVKGTLNEDELNSDMQSNNPFADSLHSGSNSGSHSSMGGTGSATSVLKLMVSSVDKSASTSLKMITQLLFLVFVLLLVVSTINLVLSLTRYTSLQFEIETVRKSYDMLQINGKTRLLMRGMLNMAQGYEPMVSPLSNDRFEMYRTELSYQLEKLKTVQDFLDKVAFDYSEDTKKYREAKSVILEYMDPNLKQTQDLQTFAYALNLYIARSNDLLTWPIERFKGYLEIMCITDPPQGYLPSLDERQIYFLIKTAQGNLRAIGKQLSGNYRDDTNTNALSVASQTELTIIVSIASIILVSIIISPIICRIEQRKYLGLKFFLSVETQHIIALENQVKEFMSLAFTEGSVHSGGGQSEENLKDKNVQRLIKAQNKFFDNNKQKRKNEGNNSSSASSSNDNEKIGSQQDNSDGFSSSNSSTHVAATAVQEVRQLPRKDSSKMIHLDEITIGVEGKPIDLFEQTTFANLQEENIVSNYTSSLGGSSVSMQQKKFGGNTVKIGLLIDLEAVEEEQLELDEKERLEEIENIRRILVDAKIVNIYTIIYRQKVKTVAFIAMLAISFCSYFIAGYFFSVQPFDMTPSIMNSLEIVYFKDVTIENAMAFVRDTLILNQTMYAVENNEVTGPEFFIQWSEDRERDYLKMRRNLPVVFADIKDYFTKIETDEFCVIAYQNDMVDRQKKIDFCLLYYDGILKRGLTYSTNYLLSHFRQVNMNYMTSDKSLKYIRGSLENKVSLQLIEMKHFLMDGVFTDMKNTATLAVKAYFQSLVKQYTILYSIFVISMFSLFFGFLIFGYTYIRDAMWKTNLSLKIMPLEIIPKHVLPELKAFFKS